MSKIHPAADSRRRLRLTSVTTDNRDPQWRLDGGQHGQRPSKLTVWKRSSMSFHGTDGFTVFNQHGKLAFRVDNYSRAKCGGGGLVLMDGVGNSLLTLRSQIWSLHGQWNAYREQGAIHHARIFSMRRSFNTLLHNNNKEEAVVFLNPQSQEPDFRIEGSFHRRNCCVFSSGGDLVAKISRKQASPNVVLANDVFSLEVRPGFDVEMIMGFVVVLDRICKKPFEPVLCS